jgi:hypothetical protein
MPDDPTEYVMMSTSPYTSRIADIPLSESKNGLTRKIVRAEVIENQADAQKSVKFAIVHQRRSLGSDWSDLGGSLAQLKAGDAAKIQLDTRDTHALLKHLLSLYEIGKEGVRRGHTVLRVADEDEVVRTEAGRARLVRKLMADEFGDEIWHQLAAADPDLATRLSMAQIYKDRLEVLEEFERNLAEARVEDYWNKFLKKNKWIFGSSYIEIIDEARIGIHHHTDIPLVTEGGFMDLIELKRPDFPFWTQVKGGGDFRYRSRYLVPHHELQGAIAQLAGYILQAEKQVSDKDFIDDHQGVVPLKPRGIVVHGRSNTWTTDHWQAFRLLNDELHGIQVITFDHLLDRARKSMEALLPQGNQPDDAPTDESGWDEAPF